jgi:hypothetical protein
VLAQEQRRGAGKTEDMIFFQPVGPAEAMELMTPNLMKGSESENETRWRQIQQKQIA